MPDFTTAYEATRAAYTGDLMHDLASVGIPIDEFGRAGEGACAWAIDVAVSELQAEDPRIPMTVEHFRRTMKLATSLAFTVGGQTGVRFGRQEHAPGDMDTLRDAAKALDQALSTLLDGRYPGAANTIDAESLDWAEAIDASGLLDRFKRLVARMEEHAEQT